MTESQIREATSAALVQTKIAMVTEGKVYPVPLAFTKCRWCGGALIASATAQWFVRVGFCSRGCVQERYDEEG